jgi:hypothetical protein
MVRAVPVRLVRKQKWESTQAVVAAARKVVDVREHQPKDGNPKNRCEICNERWPCLQNDLKETVLAWEKIS